jgi:hypothetical protein
MAPPRGRGWQAKAPRWTGLSLRVSDGTRTHDRLDHNQELYQLSYAHRGGLNLAARTAPRGACLTSKPAKGQDSSNPTGGAALITHSIEINRSPDDVFAYLDEYERHGEWQTEIVSTEVETAGSRGVGTRVKQIRKLGGRNQDTSYEVTEHNPPRRFAFRGTAGPVRPTGVATIEAVGDGTHSRLTLEFDLQGHTLFGKLIAPLARRQARQVIPGDQARLKQRLEAGA